MDALPIHESVPSSPVERGHEHGHDPQDPGRNEAVAMALNSEPRLPDQLEQLIDIQTNEFSYNNSSTNAGEIETSVSPHSTGDISEPNSTVEDDDALTDGSSSGYSSSSIDDGYSSASSDVSTITTVTTPSSTDTEGSRVKLRRRLRSRGGREEGSVLVLVGCKNCFKYFMVEKTAQVCPGCGGGDDAGGLVRFGR